MMSISFNGSTLVINDRTLSLKYAIRDAFALNGRIIVLLDPDSYLATSSYGKDRRRGNKPVHNLLALSSGGQLLWEAEFPEQADYYYRVSSKRPLTALSFSSFRCEIDPQTGAIVAREFLK